MCCSKAKPFPLSRTVLGFINVTASIIQSSFKSWYIYISEAESKGK